MKDKRRTFTLEQKDLDVIKSVQSENHDCSASHALRIIIREWQSVSKKERDDKQQRKL